MKVDRLLKSGGVTLGAMLLTMTSSGCFMNPGYAYLVPPGFSSTAHRVKMQQTNEKLITSPQTGHHPPHGEKISSRTGEVQASKEGGHWWSHWPKSPISVGPSMSMPPDSGSGNSSKVAAEPERPAS